MRLQPPKIIWLEIKSDKIAQAAVDRIEILACAIRRDVVGAAILGFRVAKRSVRWRCIHIGPLSPADWPGSAARDEIRHGRTNYPIPPSSKLFQDCRAARLCLEAAMAR